MAARTGARSRVSRRAADGPTCRDVFASPRDANTVFVALNNWQRGDYKPYLVEETIAAGRGSHRRRSAGSRTTCGRSSRITSTATCCSPGTEFGLFFTRRRRRDTGCSSRAACRRSRCATWPCRSARAIWCSATFGRGFYVLDDYSALRDMTPADADRRTRLFPASRRVPVLADRPGAGRIRRPRRDGRQLDGTESAVRRGLHLQRRTPIPPATRNSC